MNYGLFRPSLFTVVKQVRSTLLTWLKKLIYYRRSLRGTSSIVWYFFIALLLGITLVAFIFNDVNQQVVTYIAQGREEQNSTILSASTRITEDALHALGASEGRPLRRLLSNRDYIEVANLPKEPGEFSFDITGQKIVIIFLRPFINAIGETISSDLVTLNLTTASIVSKSRGSITSFYLEPSLLAPFGSGTVRAGTYRSLNEIPKIVERAVLTVEDRRFYRHWGIDPLGITRAMLRNLRAGKWLEGGSTITQQLAKNVLLTPRKTLKRKFIEWFAAISLEYHLTKDQILERYLNEVYFTQESGIAVHGIASASQAFFGKDVRDISLAEAALLAGLIQAPSAYSPSRHEDRATTRRNTVLSKMKELGEITDEEYTKAQSSPIVLNRTKIHRLHIPHFKRILEEHLASKHSVEADPSLPNTIYTGINFELQLCAENAVEATLQDLEKKSPRLRGRPVEQSLVAIEPFSGVIKAWVGGRSFSKNQFDHVTQAKRPIGSTIKPFLYITAMEPKLNSYKVATAISILSDVPTGITLFDNAKWLPKNFDHKYRGDVTLRYALEKSLNIPAVYVAQRIGIPALANTLSLFSIAESIPKVPALALGAVETSLLKLVSGYSTIANGGVRVDPRLFFSVLNQKKSLEVSTTASEKPVVSEGVAYLMTDILRGVVDRGTANIVRKLNYTGPAAGKTGTSNDARDAWFIGFTPELATGVWTGFDDNHVLGITGGEASAPTWARFMKCAEPFLSGLDFLPPHSVISLNIDTRCYGLATKSTPPDKVTSEIFVKGSQPKEPCRELEEAPSTQQVQPPASDLKNDKEIERVPSPEQTPDFKDNQPGFWERIFG